MIIDTHAHLNDERLYPRAKEIHDGLGDNGIESVINVGYDEESSERAIILSETYDKFYAAVGLHPHDSKYATPALYDKFIELSKREKCVAIGEIGLDFHYDLSPRDVQAKVFLEQVELAYSVKLPIIIHLRDGYGLMLEMLKENKRYLSYGVLLHCYSGSCEFAKELVKLDAYFAFGGAITFKNATEKPDIIRAIPRDKILLETDCPYMTPVPFRGKDNEPKYVNLVADKMSEILGINREEIEKTTIKNTREFFGKLR